MNMKRSLIIAVSFLVLVSCADTEQTPAAKKEQTVNIPVNPADLFVSNGHYYVKRSNVKNVDRIESVNLPSPNNIFTLIISPTRQSIAVVRKKGEHEKTSTTIEIISTRQQSTISAPKGYAVTNYPIFSENGAVLVVNMQELSEDRWIRGPREVFVYNQNGQMVFKAPNSEMAKKGYSSILNAHQEISETGRFLGLNVSSEKMISTIIVDLMTKRIWDAQELHAVLKITDAGELTYWRDSDKSVQTKRFSFN